MSVIVCTTLCAQPCKNLFRAYCLFSSISVPVGDNEVKGSADVEASSETAVDTPQDSLRGRFQCAQTLLQEIASCMSE